MAVSCRLLCAAPPWPACLAAGPCSIQSLGVARLSLERRRLLCQPKEGMLPAMRTPCEHRGRLGAAVQALGLVVLVAGALTISLVFNLGRSSAADLGELSRGVIEATGQWLHGDDSDGSGGWYQHSYRFILSGDADVKILISSPEADPYLILTNNQYTVAWNDQGGPSDLSALIDVSLTKGKYQLYAFTPKARLGRYNLSLRALSIASPTQGESGAAKDGSDCYDSAQDDGTRTGQRIARRLFGIRAIEAVDRCVNYEYHGYGDRKYWAGGHAGIDLQTTNVAGSRTANVYFYSLSHGTVIYAGGDKNNTIAVEVIKNGIAATILYLHARYVDVYIGQKVVPGTRLGVQGDKGYATGEHVHLEIRPGTWTKVCPSIDTCANDPTLTISYSPLDYFADLR